MSKENINVEGKEALIVGMGNSGMAATEAMLSLGANVSVQDNKDEDKLDVKLLSFLEEKTVKGYWGTHPKDMAKFDFVVLSPGVPVDLEFIKEAENAGAKIIGELELAYIVGSGKYIAITGTNGKTTTTTLVGEIYKEAGRNTYVVGNIGVPVISKALNADDDSWLITETSSFQLETVDDFNPIISAILNLTPDHMDRHKTMANYAAAKANIYKNQTEGQYCIINFDDNECVKLAKDCKCTVVPFSRRQELDFGVYLDGNYISVKDANGKITRICMADELKIPGNHNIENALAAAAIAFFGEIEATVIAETLRKFKGVEHRIELCAEVDGVRFVNDSKGTNPDAAIKAIEAMKENIILIAGGYDKNSSFDEFVESFNGRVKALLLMGKTATKIKDAAERAGFTDSIILKDMETCVKEAYRIAKPGDVVLLSPACASWDMYDCFEQRGEHFKSCVNALER